MKKIVFLLIILLPLFCFAEKVERNGTTFHWDYTLKPVSYSQVKIEKIVNTNTLRINYQGKSHILSLTGEFEPTPLTSPDLKNDYSSEGTTFLEKMCPVGSTVYIVFSSEKIDSNGVAHGYIWYKSGETWILHNLAAIANGYAIADQTNVYGNDYQDMFEEAEQTAKNNIRGIWKSVLDKSGNIVVSYSSGPMRINKVYLLGTEKYIELSNTESSRIDLTGWRLISKSNNKVYNFGDFVIKGRKKVRIYLQEHKDDLVWTGLELYYYRSNTVILVNNKNVQVSVYSW